MGDVGKEIVTVLLAIVAIAIVAVLVSNKAQTPSVISSFFQGFSSAISAAVSPVMG